MAPNWAEGKPHVGGGAEAERGRAQPGFAAPGSKPTDLSPLLADRPRRPDESTPGLGGDAATRTTILMQNPARI
jgi:hypothetical protein